MKARPILFSAPMVRALLDGSKTQTRRILKPAPSSADFNLQNVTCESGYRYAIDTTKVSFTDTVRVRWDCPYGQPGDRLWVRETTEIDEQRSDAVVLSRYSADGAPVLMSGCDDPEFNGAIAHWDYPRRSRPSIHMPRWASRILLEVVSVRVERLNDISNENALAEGVKASPGGMWSAAPGQAGTTPRAGYALLWESINGPGSWSANPFVWCVEFPRVQP
jgi:hypothetical protein